MYILMLLNILYVQKKLEEKRKWANRFISVFFSLSLTSCIIWAIPGYFRENKTLEHPSGLSYRHQSPDYEFVVSFDLLVALYAGVT